MNKLIRGIGSFVLACLLFACPICLTLIFAFGKTQEYGFFATILLCIVGLEFALLVLWLFFEYDTDE